MAKQEPTKSLSAMLKDPTLESKPELQSSALSSHKISFKEMLMAQAFNVFMTKILDDHGNVTIMNRKRQLSLIEVQSALELTMMVGECYDAVTSKPD
jgi:hypothetical protein